MGRVYSKRVEILYTLSKGFIGFWEEAISYGAYLTDKKGDRTVRIVPAKGKPNAKFKLDYLSQASKKFRNYRIKKGKRVSYSSARLIEKRKYFNDLERLGKKRKAKK